MNHKKNKKVKLAVLASGTGSLFESIVIACETEEMDADVVCLISDRLNAPVLAKAHKHNIPVQVFKQKDYPSIVKWDTVLCDYLQKKLPDWIVLAGFLKKIEKTTLKQFKNHIINIHPALLPRHGGKGMYGRRVHQSVIQSEEKTTGVSVHLVSDQYDRGPILAQTPVSVSSDDTAESLEDRVKTIERKFYVSVLKQLIKGKIKTKGIK